MPAYSCPRSALHPRSAPGCTKWHQRLDQASFVLAVPSLGCVGPKEIYQQHPHCNTAYHTVWYVKYCVNEVGRCCNDWCSGHAGHVRCPLLHNVSFAPLSLPPPTRSPRSQQLPSPVPHLLRLHCFCVDRSVAWHSAEPTRSFRGMTRSASWHCVPRGPFRTELAAV
jgi:hypothetical protein